MTTTLTFEQQQLIHNNYHINDYTAFTSTYDIKIRKGMQYLYDKDTKQFYSTTGWCCRPDRCRGMQRKRVSAKQLRQFTPSDIETNLSQKLLDYHIYRMSYTNAQIQDGNHRQRVNYFLHYMVSNRATRIHRHINNNAKKILGKHWKEHIQMMVDDGILIRSKVKTTDNSSYTFRSYKVVGDCDILRTKTIDISAVAKSVLAVTLQPLDEVAFNQMIMMSDVNIDISKEEYAELRADGYDKFVASMVDDNTGWLIDNPTKEAQQFAFDEQVEMEYQAIVDWNHQTELQRLIRTKVDLYGRRIHSLLTWTLSALRYKVSYKGEKLKLVELDVAQSQPTILADLLHTFGIDNQLVNDINNNSDLYLNINPNDRKSAKKAFFTATYAKRLSTKMATYLGADATALIEKIKTLDYTEAAGLVLSNYKNQMGLRKWLLDFPISNLKGYKRYKNMSAILQRLESFMMRKVCKALSKSNIRYVLVHDAVYVEESKQELAKELMQSVINSFLEVDFQIKE